MNNSSSDTSMSLQTNFGVKALSKLLPIAVVITLTNGFVFFLFCTRPRLRTSSNYLLLSLAVCDFFTGAINIPYFIIFSFKPRISGFWMYALHTLMAVSAAYHIFTIIAEKYFAIIRPLRHFLITKKTIFKILAGIWIAFALYAVIPITWNGSNSRNFWYTIHAIVGLVFVFFVPYTLMIYAFIIMFRAIAKRERPTSVRHTDKRRQEQKSINDRKCVFVFATMAAIFAICWLPYFTIMLVYIFYNKYYQTSNYFSSIKKAAEVFTIVRYMTSAFNPLLYTFFKRDFLFALRTLRFKREPCLPPESESSLRCKRWRSRRSTSISTKSYLLPGNERRPDMSRYANVREQIIYITSV